MIGLGTLTRYPHLQKCLDTKDHILQLFPSLQASSKKCRNCKIYYNVVQHVKRFLEMSIFQTNIYYYQINHIALSNVYAEEVDKLLHSPV